MVSGFSDKNKGQCVSDAGGSYEEEKERCNDEQCPTTTYKPIKLNNEQKGGILLFFLLIICLSPLGIATWVCCLCACGIFLYQRSQNKNNARGPSAQHGGGGYGQEDWDDGEGEY